MADSCNGTDRMKFSDWELKMSNFLSVGDHEHAGDILKLTTQEQEERYLFTVLSNRKEGTPHGLVRNGRHKDGVNAWRRLHMEYTPVTSATAQREEVAEDSPHEVDSRREQRDTDVGGTGQKVRGDKKYDNDMMFQRLYDFFPKPSQQHTSP